MITENQEYLYCIEKLNAINYLIEATANHTTGDDVKYAREALYFLSQAMTETTEQLKQFAKTKV